MRLHKTNASRHYTRPDRPLYDARLLARVKELLSYDPVSGLLTWRVARPPRIKPGDEAGSVLPNGYVTVCIDGWNYYGHHLAFALTHDIWAEPYLLRLQGAKDDLRLSNMVYDRAYGSTTDPAILERREKARNRARRQRERERRIKAQIEMTPSMIEGVEHMPGGVGFKVSYRATPQDHYRVIAENILTKREAEALSYDFRRRMHFLDHHPVPVPASEAEHRQWESIYAASGDITYDYVRQVFAYDPLAGDIIWRYPEARRGHRADHRIGRHMYVDHLGRKFPAHLLIWFLVHKVWPKRGQIGWRNGDQTDNRLDNLFLKEQA